MDIVSSYEITDAINALHDEEERLASTARQFPPTPEAYRTLPSSERLDVARRMMDEYANIGSSVPRHKTYDETPLEQDCATATVSTDDPNVFIDARVAFDSEGNWASSGDQMSYYSKPAIIVWAKARNQVTGVSGEFQTVGRICYNRYREGTRGDDDRRILHHYVETEKFVVLGWNRRFTGIEEDDSEVNTLITLIDEATCNLITGVVTRNRNLGTLAVSSSNV